MQIRAMVACGVFVSTLALGSGGRAAPISVFCDLLGAVETRLAELESPETKDERRMRRALKRVRRLARKSAKKTHHELKINVSLAKLRSKKFTRSVVPVTQRHAPLYLEEQIAAPWNVVDQNVLSDCGTELNIAAGLLAETHPSVERANCELVLSEAVAKLMAVAELTYRAAGPPWEEYAEGIIEVRRLMRRVRLCLSQAMHVKPPKPSHDNVPCTGTQRGRGSVTLGARPPLNFDLGGGVLELPAKAKSALMATIQDASGQRLTVRFVLTNPNKEGKRTLDLGDFDIDLRLTDDEGAFNRRVQVTPSQILIDVRSVKSCGPNRAFGITFSDLPIDVFDTASPFVPIESTTLSASLEIEVPVAPTGQ